MFKRNLNDVINEKLILAEKLWARSGSHQVLKVERLNSIDFELITLKTILFNDHSKRFDCKLQAGDTSGFNFIDFYQKINRDSNGTCKKFHRKLSFSTRNHK